MTAKRGDATALGRTEFSIGELSLGSSNVYRRQGTPACTANSVNDTDDLVFAVGN